MLHTSKTGYDSLRYQSWGQYTQSSQLTTKIFPYNGHILGDQHITPTDQYRYIYIRMLLSTSKGNILFTLHNKTIQCHKWTVSCIFCKFESLKFFWGYKAEFFLPVRTLFLLNKGTNLSYFKLSLIPQYINHGFNCDENFLHHKCIISLPRHEYTHFLNKNGLL